MTLQGWRRAWMCWGLWVASTGLALGQGNERRFELHLTQGKLSASQRMMRVTQGDTVHWRIFSDTAGELHLHAYGVQVPVLAGQVAESTFVAHTSGRYRLQWHAPTSSRAPTQGEHHTPALGVIEVHPK